MKSRECGGAMSALVAASSVQDGKVFKLFPQL
jgi:hypothetical protein